MRSVVVAGVGMTPFGRFPDRSLRSLCAEAVTAALADAGVTPQQVERVFFGNAAAGLVTGQEMIRAQASLRGTGLSGLPMVNVENACASGSTAFHLAVASVMAGQSDIALVVGAEKLSHADKQVSFRALGSGVDLDEPRPVAAASGGGSIFMEIYAAKTRTWMAETGATVEDLARVCVKSRRAGALNACAQFRDETTIAAVLASRTISPPLTLPMCSGIGDGAAAVVVMDAQRARQLGVMPVFVRASALVSAADDESTPVCAIRSSAVAYKEAGIGPDDIHVAELHDASAPAELIHYENLGFCRHGEASALIRSGATDLGGRLSVNPSGGLLSRGHPVGATGVAQIVEITQQLRAAAGARQRPDAKVGLAENNGGQIGSDAAVAVTTILTR
ncbi:MAG TPA: thiolase family protein [Vineibacter sp.]|nr:thiolase family protein [Vineibacter sp.]